MTAGLTIGHTVTRVIHRDVCGKTCWDSTVLYGPPKCRAGSFPAGMYISKYGEEVVYM